MFYNFSYPFCYFQMNIHNFKIKSSRTVFYRVFGAIVYFKICPGLLINLQLFVYATKFDYKIPTF